MNISEDNYQTNRDINIFSQIKNVFACPDGNSVWLSHNECIFVDGPDGFHKLSLLEVLKAL